MRIGYVLKKFPRISETFILNEILELTKKGAEVTVFSTRPPDDGLFHRSLADLANPVVYLPAPRSQQIRDQLCASLPLLRGARDQLFEQMASMLQEGRRDVWTVLRQGIEVAVEARRRGISHLHAHFATVAAQVAGVAHAASGLPFSITCHAKDIYREGIQPAHFQRLATTAEFLVTVCNSNAEHIQGKLKGEAEIEVRTLYNGVDLSLFHPRSRKPVDAPLVLGVGRLVEKKGFHFLLEALASLQRRGVTVACQIIGEGEDRAALEARSVELGIKDLRFLGLKTQDETRELMGRATLLALPCIIGTDGNRDALPTVLLEALGIGLPVISTPVVGVAEIVDDGRAGGLVPPADPSALANEIERLLGDPAARDEFSRRGRERAETLFDLQKNVATLLGWFQHSAETARLHV